MDKKCLESMKVIFATSNQGKIDQVKEIFKLNNVILNIKSEKEVKFNEDVVEDGKTFEENSKIKALALKNFCDKNEIEYDNLEYTLQDMLVKIKPVKKNLITF